MKDYVLHKINYLQHNKFKLEERIEMLSRSDGDVTSVSQKMIALELVRITQQMKGLDHCLTMMDAYQIETNQGKDGSGESLSDQERAWENLILGFVVATGAASQLLQEKGKGLRTSRPLLEEAKEKISERFLNTFSYGNGHVGKVSVNAAELLNPTDDDAKSARLALKRILFKQNPSAQIKGANRVLADSLVFVLPGLENNDILTMFERFEIPNRSDLTKVQSGRLPGSGGYVRKRGWFDKRVDKSDGEYRFSHGSILPWRRPAVADALINRLNPAQPPTPALLVN